LTGAAAHGAESRTGSLAGADLNPVVFRICDHILAG
jgi:hypothetical protein